MSSGRSRSGGSRIGNTLMRYQRSSRKRALADHRGEVAVRRGDDAHVDVQRRAGRRRARSVPSCSTRSSRTCAGERQLADLVEEQRAAVGALEPALALRDRAGEAAALVAEQLGVDQLGRDRAAVDAQERARRAPRALRGSRARPPPCPSRSRRGSAPARRCGATCSTRSITVAQAGSRRRRSVSLHVAAPEPREQRAAVGLGAASRVARARAARRSFSSATANGSSSACGQRDVLRLEASRAPRREHQHAGRAAVAGERTGEHVAVDASGSSAGQRARPARVRAGAARGRRAPTRAAPRAPSRSSSLRVASGSGPGRQARRRDRLDARCAPASMRRTSTQSSGRRRASSGAMRSSDSPISMCGRSRARRRAAAGAKRSMGGPCANDGDHD